MKQHPVAVGRLTTLKLLAQRFTVATLVVASFALMLWGKADTMLSESARVAVSDVTAPILNAMSQPASTAADFVSEVRELATLRQENARLSAENQSLLHWQTMARQLEVENRLLKTQMNYVSDPDPSFITTRVVGDMGGAYVHSMLVNAGARDGVRKGQAAVAGEMLVGRVMEVGERSARILLLTDINSHLPVLMENSRAKAILIGDNSDRPRLSYISQNAVAEPGERVVTSGHGGAFPPGIPVGVVVSVHDGVARVEPFVHRHRLEYVTIIDYGLAGILQAELGGGTTR